MWKTGSGEPEARVNSSIQSHAGAYDIAVDVVQAGPGDTVLVIDEGNGARQILQLDPGAIRAVIVGVVDEVAVGM